MNCEEIREYLSPFIDEELSAADSAGIADHLRMCSSCQEYFEEQGRLDTEVSGLIYLARPEVDPENAVRKWREVVDFECASSRSMWKGVFLTSLTAFLVLLMVSQVPFHHNFCFRPLNQCQSMMLENQSDSYQLRYQVEALLTAYSNNSFSHAELKEAVRGGSHLSFLLKEKEKAQAKGDFESYRLFTSMEIVLITVMNENEAALKNINAVLL